MRKIYLVFVCLFISVIAFCQNPFMLKDVYPGATGSGIQQIVKTTNYTFFNAEDDDADPDRGLYRTDGTVAGTIKLNLDYRAVTPGYVSTKAEKLTAVGNKIIFAGDNFPNYGEIWSSDGTQAGTIAIERFQPTTPNKVPVIEIAKYGTDALYSVINNSNHALLKKTNGTLAGTSLVFDFNTIFTSAPDVLFFKELNGIIYFIVYDGGGTGYDHLWRTNGTTAGTYELKDFGATQYVASNIMVAGNNLYLMIVTPGTGNVLWKSDGTVAGTLPVKTIGTTGNNNYPQNAAIGSTLYFSGLDANGMELWKTDGTAGGTVMVADINSGSASSSPSTLTVLNNNLYFNATIPATGSELWKYDGVNASLVKDIIPGTLGSGPSSLVVSNNTILFRAGTPASGSELWITDGTSANTLQIADINPGNANSTPNILTPGNPVYFSATNGVNGTELFKYDNNGDALAGPHRFYVNDNNTAGDVFTLAIGNNANNGSKAFPFATIEYAYSIAQPGDSILVDAGTYNLSGATISLSKSMTLLGTNYQVSPNDAGNKLMANNSRTAESIITNGIFTIASNDLSLKGFTFDMGDHRAIELQNSAGTNNDFGNFLFEKNILKINAVGNFNQFPITGKLVTLPSLPITSGYTFTDNRFQKSGSALGTTFNFNYVKNVTVTGNAFVVTGTTFKTQQVANIGNTGIVDNYNFLNNVADGAGIIANCARLSSGIISQNILNNCDRGINVVGTMPQSSSLEFNNNTLIQTTGGTPFLGYNRTGTSDPNVLTIFKVQNNIMYGTRVPGLTNQFFGAMNFTLNNSEKNPVFTISGNQIVFSGDYSSVTSEQVRPITVRGNIVNLTLSDNEISFNNSGTILPAVGLPANPGITINTEFGTGAFIPANALINMSNNKIQGFKQSIVFYDGTNGINPYIGYGNIPPGAVVNINNNSFTGDSISINSGDVGEMINANCNWYGFKESQNVSPKVTETTVNHAPWLTNGTDTDVATGFQPVANVCNGVPVDADIITVTNVTCNGAANGSIDASVEEGVAPFTYAWFKNDVAGFSTSEDLAGLAPGEYKLIVTDVNGSTDTVFAAITEPDVLSASATGKNNVCHGGTIGSTDLTVNGGTLPYAFLWSNGVTTESLGDLAAGNYSVTITDANGCTVVASYEVTQPTQLTATITGSSSSCANTATVGAAGGTGSYSYLWSNGATSAFITSVPAGTYTVTVTDANGCTAVANTTLTASEAFNPSAQATDVTCYNNTNGTITVTNVNAVAPFTYSIDGLQFQSSATFNNLPAGTYTVTVVDKNGCTGFITKTISQPPQLTVVLNTVQSTCFNLSTGGISVTTAGGTGGLSYVWTGPNNYTSTQKNITGVAAGPYMLTVTDNNGCTVQLNAVVPTYNAITVTPTIVDIRCRGEINGKINLTVSGGTGSGFTYSWNTGATSKDIANMAAGNNYKITITDIGSGCVENRTYAIIQPASNVSISATKTNVLGCGTGLGTITSAGSGGTGSYQYKLDNGSYQGSGIFSGLYAGDFTVWVKDANGCTASKLVSITDNGTDQYESNNSKNQASPDTIGKIVNARIALSTDIADWFKFTTPIGSSKSYTITLSHPSVTYTFNLYAAGNNTPALVPVSSATGTKTYTLTGNATYYISITGGLSYNCYQLVVSPTALPTTRTSATSADVGYTKKPVEVKVAQLEASVYPNPHHGMFNLLIKSPENAVANIEMFNAGGQKVITKRVQLKAGSNTVNFTDVKESLLLYRVTIGNNNVSGKVIGPN